MKCYALSHSGALWLAALLSLLGCGGTTIPPDPPPQTAKADPAFAHAIAESRRVLERRLTKQPGLSVAVAEGGRLVWEEGLGWAAVAPKLAASAGTRFRLYSVAKPITGALAVKLAREGRLSFDRAISAYLPGLPASLGALTLRRLLGHVSGIRDYRRGEWIPLARKHCDSALAAIEPFRNDPLEFKPGERFSYSSFNYVLGSAVIEAATGEPFHDLLQREIFAPAEMERTGPDTPKAEAEAGTRFFQARPFGRVRRAIPVDNSCKFGG
jgi:serine beta-lactamase-like protein LACTB